MKVRIKFSKYGALRFIGHLDVMRYFQKAIRRAEIDIAYSEGFSPHQIMSFASPLSVGHTSSGEYFDIEVNSFTDEEDMRKRLQDVMAEGIDILKIKLLPEKEKNAMASVDLQRAFYAAGRLGRTASGILRAGNDSRYKKDQKEREGDKSERRHLPFGNPKGRRVHASGRRQRKQLKARLCDGLLF